MRFAPALVSVVGFSLSPPWLTAAAAAELVPDAEPGMRGYWQEPLGGVIEVAPCAGALCLRIVALSPGKHPNTDAHNPDPKLRARALCRLIIGQNFTEIDRQHAVGGRLYDPRSGQTYSGIMTAEGGKLKLRGYLGIELFGRTQTWTRVGPSQATCTVM
jgi:uncharacterized protein (DUF2147 family)